MAKNSLNSSISGNIPLNVGDNVITVQVTPQIGDTNKTYSVTVTRSS